MWLALWQRLEELWFGLVPRQGLPWLCGWCCVKSYQQLEGWWQSQEGCWA